jgi:hypothetical protein
MKFTQSSLIFLAYATTSMAQAPPCGSQSQELTYNLCRERTEEFRTSTCGPMSNSTMQALCDCYYQRDLLNCFAQCLDAGPTAEKATLLSSATASCSAIGYPAFPNGLPSPAPWQTDFGVPAATTTPSNTNAAATPTGTAGSSSDKDSGAGRIAAGTLIVLAFALLL